ncbi:MAG: FAD-linked oxidase C-terminal domain-containing protein [Acidimicrobiia bacterium]
MTGIETMLGGIVGSQHLSFGSEIVVDDTHDESLTAAAVTPIAVVRPSSATEIAAVLAVAAEHHLPITARGSGTGMSGAAVPDPNGIVVSLSRMNAILEIDTENHIARVQAGVTLVQLDEALQPLGLVYPVFPGENSASLGGNVNTNAGGMRAVKYGVTRHHVLGVEAVLASGEIIRSGGKYVKASTGYDLTQLIIGSEGTLAIVTEVTLKLQPRRAHAATVLVPFETLDEVVNAVPPVVASGLAPLIVEYIDLLTMAAIQAEFELPLGIPKQIQDQALAYLVIVLESNHEDRLDEDVAAVAELVGTLGALDVYVLPPKAATDLIEAREKAFFLAKGAGANEIVDVVVPRSCMPEFMRRVSALAAERGTWIAGCGHAGDGNVHLSVFQGDPDVLHETMMELYRIGHELGGTISGEHGLGTEKRPYYLALEDPVKIALMKRIKSAFDPMGLLNPGKIFGEPIRVHDHV